MRHTSGPILPLTGHRSQGVFSPSEKPFNFAVVGESNFHFFSLVKMDGAAFFSQRRSNDLSKAIHSVRLARPDIKDLVSSMWAINGCR